MKNSAKILCLILCLCLCCPILNVFAESSTASGVVLYMDNVRNIPAGKNLISKKLPYKVHYLPGGQPYLQTYDLPENINMTDGDVTTDWLDNRFVFADYNGGNPIIYSNGESRFDAVFCLDKVTDITKICLINHATAALMTEKYELYASNELRSLFWSKNRIAYVENPDSKDRQIFNCNIQDVSFFAIRVLYPVQIGDTSDLLKVTSSYNNHYPRINELAIYGTESDQATSLAAVNSCNKTQLVETCPVNETLEFTNRDVNFFYGMTGTAYTLVNNNGYEYEGQIAATNTSALTDGNIAYNSSDWLVAGKKFATKDGSGNVTLLGSDSHYIDVRLNASTAQNLGMLYIKHHDNKALRTMHYKVFASTDTSGRTAAENLIAEVRNNNGSQEHYLVVPKDQTINAMYFTIRIYDPCYDYTDSILASLEADNTTITNSYVRLLEVAAFSRETLSAKIQLDNIGKIDDNNYGYIKPGTKVKSVLNAFSGSGSVCVEDAQGNIKAPSQALEFGDKVTARSDYSTDASAGFKFRGDLNNSSSLSLSDLQLLCNAIINNSYDVNLADVDANGTVEVTDVLCLAGAITGTYEGTEDTSPNPPHGIKGGVDADEYKISVDTDTFLNENFRGFGTNSFTSILTAEGMQAYGYNKVYHELTAKRLASMKHPVSRIWFQPDWIVTDTLGDNYKNYETNWQSNPDYINYKNGIYDFDNEIMNAFYEYVEMLADTGCNIEINFGWKTATRIKDWFNTPCDDYMLGAPKDLPAFGKAAAALIKHLNKVKGYDFVEAITFYNEPNLEGDFDIGTDNIDEEKAYWSQLIREVDAALKENGMRDKVEIWGPELSNIHWDVTKDWFQYQLANTNSYIDQWTGHHYYEFTESQNNNYSAAFDTFLYYAENTGGNMMVTEMYSGISSAETFRDFRNWNDSFAGYYIAVSNTGLNGMLTWGSVGGYLPSPMYMKLDGGPKAAWAVPVSEKAAADVKTYFYEQSIFTNYIPDGSKVLYTYWLGRDIRSAAYLLPDGNVTVVVENNGNNDGAVFKNAGAEKTVEISLDDGADRTFNRISFFPGTQKINANAIVNRPDKTIEAVGGKFTDTLGTEYSVHVYTTAPIIKQVEMKEVILHATPGSQVQIEGKLLDCAEDDEIVYTVSEHTGSVAGTITADGLYTVPTTAKSGDMVAVRASLKSDPKVYGVSIIYID